MTQETIEEQTKRRIAGLIDPEWHGSLPTAVDIIMDIIREAGYRLPTQTDNRDLVIEVANIIEMETIRDMNCNVLSQTNSIDIAKQIVGRLSLFPQPELLSDEDIREMVDGIFSYFAHHFGTGGREDVHRFKHYVLTKYLGDKYPKETHLVVEKWIYTGDGK